MRSLLILIILVVPFVGRAQEHILPTPSKLEFTGGYSSIEKHFLVNFASLDDFTIDYFSDLFQDLHDVSVVNDSSKFALQFSQKELPGSDTYQIQFEPQNKVVYYEDDQALFQALISLSQSVSQDKKIKHFVLSDGPRFSWRGLHLDVSRHFFNVDEVKRFIDLMAFYKFNVFHWHLTDDQGWRIEIEAYPKLTEVSAFRDTTLMGHYSDFPRRYNTNRYGGFYSKAEIKEVIAYAEERHVSIVPEIELPGHSRAALAAYPELSCTGQKQAVPGLWGIFDDIYCSKPESMTFLKTVLAEVCELFPGEYIHIGGDEAPKKRWKSCEACQRTIIENDLEDEHELQSLVIQQMDKFLQSKGKKLIGWDEILEGGLSEGAAVMSWRGMSGGKEAAEKGHEVVMTPTSHCYFDYYQSGYRGEPVAIGGYLPVEKVYQFDPVPSDLPEDKHKYIIGGQANLWTEYIPTFSHLEYMTYPRAIALAQTVWSTNKPEYDEFESSLVYYHEELLSKRGVNYSQSMHIPAMRIHRAEDGLGIVYETAQDSTVLNIKHSFSDEEKVLFSDQFVMLSGVTTFINRFDKERTMDISVTTEQLRESVNYQLKLHEGIGLPVQLCTEPAPKYNVNGDVTLVDGLRGAIPWKGNEWLGYQETEIIFIVDLLEERKVQGFDLGILNSPGSWIYLPKTIHVEISNNGKRWKSAGSYEVSETWSERTNSSDVSFSPVNCQYVRVRLETMDVIPDGTNGAGHVPWTFIDEFEPKFLKNEN